MSKLDHGVVYRISCNTTDKWYVGQTLINTESRKKKNAFDAISYRLNQHCLNAMKGREDCPKLYNAIRKYGIESFKVDVLEVCSVEILNERETYFIDKLNVVKNGYNIASGGAGVQLDKTKKMCTSQKISQKIRLKHMDIAYKEKQLKARSDVTYRKKLSEKRKKSDLPLNLSYRRHQTNICGVEVIIRYNGTTITKSFASSKKSTEANIRSALAFRNEKLTSLGLCIPDNIMYVGIFPTPSGFDVNRSHGSREEYARFMTLEECFSFQDDPRFTIPERISAGLRKSNRLSLSHRTHTSMPKCVCALKERGKIVGYKAIFTLLGKRITRSCISKKETLEQKLETVTKWLELQRKNACNVFERSEG